MERFGRLATVPPGERTRLAREAARGGDHGVAAESVPALLAVETEAAAGRSAPAGACRVVAWNAERCRDPRAAAALLAPSGAVAWLLTELDVGMARSGQAHTARDLADELAADFAFGVEFLELGLGGAREREAHAGMQNEVGYHGAAVLSPCALERPALVRLDSGGDWWDGRRSEVRVGGRIAVLATIEVAGTPVTLAAVHLESHCGPGQRDAQIAALLGAVDRYAPGQPVLIGGDVNTHALSQDALEDPKEMARLLREDPNRFRDPVRHEPLFERLRTEGFDFTACNCTGTSTQRNPEGRGALHLDWFFARGLETSHPEVIAAVDPDSGAPLSDHEAIAVTIHPRP
jgi:endonuclease/exonuclease/phosphatase family metal-dependent hydrolase